jgi:hypothetical protein
MILNVLTLISQITINGSGKSSDNVTITVGSIICSIIVLLFWYYKREVIKSDEVKRELQLSQKRDVDTLIDNIKDIKAKMDEIHDFITVSKEKENHRVEHLKKIDDRLNKVEHRLSVIENKN